jgi:polyhydroxybutyrate depolymerase
VTGRAASLVALGVSVLAIVGAVAAFAHQQQASTRVGASRPASRPACASPGPGDHRVAVEAGRAPVLLHVPPGRAARPRPLILVLPGAGMTGSDMARYTGYSRLADARRFLVAYPTASGRRPFWNVSTRQPGKPDDVDYLRRVIAALTGPDACGDPARVGVTGVSNGGGMTALLACRAADLLAAAAPVAGGYSTLPDCRARRALPILEIHGLRDEVVPYAGKAPSHAGAVGAYVDGWRARDRCSSRAVADSPAPRVLELRWTCPAGRMVLHDRVYDAEHGWPGENSLRPFSSTVRTWRFLSSFRDDLRPG